MSKLLKTKLTNGQIFTDKIKLIPSKTNKDHKTISGTFYWETDSNVYVGLNRFGVKRVEIIGSVINGKIVELLIYKLDYLEMVLKADSREVEQYIRQQINNLTSKSNLLQCNI